jgi:hypothetical protein
MGKRTTPIALGAPALLALMALLITACTPAAVPSPTTWPTNSPAVIPTSTLPAPTAQPTSPPPPTLTAPSPSPRATKPPAPPSTPVLLTPAPPPVVSAAWTTYSNANLVYDLAFDHDGNLWTAGSGGLVKWDFKDSTYTKYTTEHGLPDNVITAVAFAPDGALWLGTFGSGVSRFDGATWTTYTTADGLANNLVRAIAVAADGSLWFGTWGGVSNYVPSK